MPKARFPKFLKYLADEFNAVDQTAPYDEFDEAVLEIFNIFPQSFIDGDSLYVVPITKKMALPDVLTHDLGLSADERALRKLTLQEQSRRRFSRKNINSFVDELLKDSNSVLASTLPLETKRDLIKLIFISLYGRDKKSIYSTSSLNELITVNNFKFQDFLIQRRER